MVRAGKILYAGISDTPAWIVSRANMLPSCAAGRRSWLADSLQPDRSGSGARSPADGASARHRRNAVGRVGHGILSGKYNREGGSGRVSTWGPIDPKKLAIAGRGDQDCRQNRPNPSQVALNWVRQQPGVIHSHRRAKTLPQVQDNLACLDFKLSDEHLQHLNDISKIELGFPHDFLAEDGVRDLVFAARTVKSTITTVNFVWTTSHTKPLTKSCSARSSRIKHAGQLLADRPEAAREAGRGAAADRSGDLRGTRGRCESALARSIHCVKLTHRIAPRRTPICCRCRR